MISRNRPDLRLPPGGAEATEAIINYVSDRSVAFIFSEPDGGVSIGTGTSVLIGSHHLVATAAHLFEGVGDDSQILIVPRGLRNHPGISFLGRSHHTSAEPDVAWVELEQSSAAESGLRFLRLDDLHCGQRHDPQMPFFVQGFPSAEAIVADGRTIHPFSLGLLTSSVESEAESDQLLLEYPPQSADDHGLELVEPKGISGGGIWLYPRFDDSPVWSAERTKLVAITRSWVRAKSRLRTEPIERWLRRVACDFSELRDVIEAKVKAVGICTQKVL